MLTVYFGNDASVVRNTAKEKINTDAATDIEVITIEADSYQVGQVTEALGGTSLFATPYHYVLDTPSAHADFEKELQANLEDMRGSVHQFTIIETTLTAAQKKHYAKHAEQLIDCSIKKPQRANAFGMTDYLCRRDKKQLWIELQTALSNGLSPEEIIGTLWWQLKTIRLAAVTNSASEAGMKEFPYKKAKQTLQAFSLPEVEQLSRQLLAVYHDGHSGKRDITLALEEWVLRV